MNILVIHGPNLNLLGEREGDEKGRTLEDLNHQLQALAEQLEVDLRVFHSNHEGAIVDKLHAERRWADGILINPGALTHTSYVLREALAAVNRPTLEVHLTDIRRRESWRRKSVIKDVCAAQVMGKGFDSYVIALQRMADGDLLGKKKRRPVKLAKAVQRPAARAGPAAASQPAEPRAMEKTIGRAEPAASPPARKGARTGERNELRAGFISRSLVRQKITDRLSGKLSAAGLATWARAQWLEVQRGAAAESGHRELLEDSLQTLTLSAIPATRLSDEQLVDLMAQLEG